MLRERLAELGHAVHFGCELNCSGWSKTKKASARLATPAGEETLHLGATPFKVGVLLATFLSVSLFQPRYSAARLISLDG